MMNMKLLAVVIPPYIYQGPPSRVVRDEHIHEYPLVTVKIRIKFNLVAIPHLILMGLDVLKVRQK